LGVPFVNMGNQSCLPLDPVTNKFTERGGSVRQNIEFAVSGMKGFRRSMEDHHLYYTFIPVPEDLELENALADHSVFAVFDGHGGSDFTSKFLKDNFMAVFAQQPEMALYMSMEKTGEKSRADVNGVNLLKQALVGAFLALDRKLRILQKERNVELQRASVTPASSDSEESDSDEEERKPLMIKSQGESALEERSGSTGIVLVLTPTHIICANTGDSRGILRRNGNTLPLSFDQKPSNLPERQRITKAKGTVKSKRVDGDLAVSRAFGDYIYKEDTSLADDKQKVIVVPDLVVYPRNMKEDEFIILACDGIWDVASSTQCSSFVQSLLSEGETDLGNIAEEALDTCLERLSSDNMTLMLVGLPGLKKENGPSAVVSNALWGQRSTRKARLLSLHASKTSIEATIKASDFTSDAFLRVVDELNIEPDEIGFDVY
jgi:serine/threonine protein phosphatase PrpC